jgi:tetratricopeptide (TPR) repeat protein
MITETDSLKKRVTDYIDRKMLVDAKNLLVQQLNSHPMDMEAKMLLGRVLLEMGEEQAAFELLREIETAFIEFSMSFVYLGDAYRNRGRNREARDCYHRFVELNPKSEMSEDISRIIDSMKAKDEQRGYDNNASDEVAEIAPEFYTITLADLYVRQGHSDMAREVLEKILIKDPANEDAAKRLKEIKPPLSTKSDGVALENGNKNRIIARLNDWLININRKSDRSAVH